MTGRAIVRVDVVEAGPARRERLEALVRPYLEELALYENDHDSADVTAYPWLDLYWRQPGRHPFLILVEGEPAGFALVRRVDAGADVASVMAEFYVVPEHRRAGVGRHAALCLFRRFPGPWLVRQLVANAPARAFWTGVIAALTQGRFQERLVEGGLAIVAELVAPPAAPR